MNYTNYGTLLQDTVLSLLSEQLIRCSRDLCGEIKAGTISDMAVATSVNNVTQ